LSTKYQPNIIIINGGTNDCLQNYAISDFTTRYNALLDSLYGAIPNVTIVASLVLPGTANGIPQNRGAVNTQIRNLVADRRRNRNQKIVLADVDAPAGFFTTNHLVADGIHPNDDGHRRLAALYMRAVNEANSAGFLSPPADTGMSDEAGAGSGGNTCDKTYGSGASSGPVNTQAGSGLDDGIYIHSSISRGTGPAAISDKDFNIAFARLGKAFGNHDLVSSINSSAGHLYWAFPNIGGGWDGIDRRTLQLADACTVGGVRWVDVDGKLVLLPHSLLPDERKYVNKDPSN